MKYLVLMLLLITTTAHGQMEKRLRVLYDRKAFRKRSPAVGKSFPELVLRDLKGKKVSLKSLRTKPLVVIGGAYT